MNPDQIDQVNQFVAALREHPYWAHTGLLIALVTGVMLWASGRRVLKPAFAVIGALLGGFLGHALVPAVGFDSVFGAPGDLAGALGGGMLGALGALLIFRLAIGVLASGVLAGLGILAAAVLIQMNPAPPPETVETAASPFVEVRPSTEDELAQDDSATSRLREMTLDDAKQAAEDPGTFAKDLFVGLKAETWDPLTVQQRTLEALQVPGRAILDRSAVQWTAIWIIVSLTGLLIQTMGLKERGDKRDGRRGDDWDDEQRSRRKATRRRRQRRQRDDDDYDDDDDDWD
jgi:hypothetical protein